MSFLVLALLLSPVFLLVAISRNYRRQVAIRAATVDIAVDASGAHRTLADGRRESVEWHDVTEVDVFTTRVGPHEAAGGAVVLYGDETNGCIIPLDKVAESGLFDHITRLPGFDYNAFIKAVTADPDAGRQQRTATSLLVPRPLQVTTVVWTREVPDETEADDGLEHEDES